MNRLPGQGEKQVWCYFAERLQDEAAFHQPRMWYHQVSFVNDAVAMQQQVEIHPAWPLMDRPDATKSFIFDPQKVYQQGVSVKTRRESEHRIVERVLVYVADRRCLVKGGEGRNSTLRQPADFSDGPQEVELTVSHIGAKCYVSFDFHSVIKA